MIGLEIKREMLVGELSEPRQAILPIVAAFGGMVVPALFFLLFNAKTSHSSGWGIPMATDIAFAIGMLGFGSEGSIFGQHISHHPGHRG